MAFTMAQDDAVFTWTFTDLIDAETFFRWSDEMRSMTFASPLSAIYHVMDVRAAHSDFGAIMAQMRHVGQEPPSVAYEDKHKVQIMIVGADAMARLASDLAKLPQFGGFTMPVFRTMEDALEFIRIDQKQNQGVRASRTSAE